MLFFWSLDALVRAVCLSPLARLAALLVAALEVRLNGRRCPIPLRARRSARDSVTPLALPPPSHRSSLLQPVSLPPTSLPCPGHSQIASVPLALFLAVSRLVLFPPKDEPEARPRSESVGPLHLHLRQSVPARAPAGSALLSNAVFDCLLDMLVADA